MAEEPAVRTDPSSDWNNPEIENGALELLRRYQEHVQSLSNELEESAAQVPRSWRNPQPDDQEPVIDVYIPLSMWDGSVHQTRQAERVRNEEVDPPVMEWAYEKAKWAAATVLTYAGLPERFREYWDQYRTLREGLQDYEFIDHSYPEAFYEERSESGWIYEPPLGGGAQYRDEMHGEYQGEQWWDWKIEYQLPDADPPTWSGSLEEGYNHGTFPQLMTEIGRIGYQKSTTTALRYKRQKYNGLAYASKESGAFTFSYCGVNMNTAGQFTNDTDDDLDIVVEGNCSITVTVPPDYPPETPEDPWPEHLVPLVFDYRLRAEFTVYVNGSLAYESSNSVHDFGGGEGTDPGGDVTCEHSDSYTITVPAHSTVYFSVNAGARQNLYTGFWTVIGMKPHTGLPLPSTQSAEVSFWGRGASFSRSYPGQEQNYGWADNTGQIPPPGD